MRKQIVVCDLLLTGMFDYLPYIVEKERGCTFITARSKVEGGFRVFIEDEDFVMKVVFKMPLEKWSAVKYITSIWKETDITSDMNGNVYFKYNRPK